MPGRRLDAIGIERHGSHSWLLLDQPVEHLGIEGVGGGLRVFPLLGGMHREAVDTAGNGELGGDNPTARDRDKRNLTRKTQHSHSAVPPYPTPLTQSLMC